MTISSFSASIHCDVYKERDIRGTMESDGGAFITGASQCQRVCLCKCRFVLRAAVSLKVVLWQ